MTGSARIIQADSRALPLADESVDLVVTSPPYFGLRSYQDGGEHYQGQIGDEATPAEFIAALLDVTRECMRVLKPSGSMFVNLGDRYAGGGGQWDKDARTTNPSASHAQGRAHTGGKTYGLRAKSLILIPDPLGKLPGSVWTIPTQPLKVPAHLGIDHFAAFPMEWPRRIIRGWSAEGVCTACGEGRRPVAGHTEEWRAFRQEHGMGDYVDRSNGALGGQRDSYAHGLSGAKIAAGISVDMSADYCRLADWRTNDPGELARAMQVDKPPQQLDGQLGMFEESA